MSDDTDIAQRIADTLAPHVNPDAPEREPDELTKSVKILAKTGFCDRYRDEWERPEDTDWQTIFSQALWIVGEGGTIVLTGNRGTGKTRLAAEVIRDKCRVSGVYITALGLFLRLRSAFNSKKGESEAEIVEALTAAPVAVIDEIQERGGSEWEDRILTHIIDQRYSAVKPTIIIANLKAEEIEGQLGPSIVDRIKERGGIIEMKGESHRGKQS